MASACEQTDSIKGLAQAIAKPAYRRLIDAEPALRRTVPILIIAFLVTICAGAFVQILSQHRQNLNAVRANVAATADLLASRIDTMAAGKAATPDIANRIEAIASSLIPGWGDTQGRHIVVTNFDGTLMARIKAPHAGAPTAMSDLLQGAQPLTLRGGRANDLDIELPNGISALAATRVLKSVNGHLLVVQEVQPSLWKADSALTMTLTVTAGFVVLILGFAFHWQSTLSRETDLINEAVRSRIDTALNRGRCGLWDWDLASGRIFWSRSMFEILGLEHRTDLLTFGEIQALIHPDDVDLYHLANNVLESKIEHIDHAFRVKHANGGWIWLRARCELVSPKDGGTAHLIGIAIDVTEQQSLAERSAEADLRLRDAIETIPEAFVLWDAENRLILCNSYFQSLHQLTDDAVRPGTSYEAIIETGNMPVARTHMSETDQTTPGARTFEAELQDGRWLHISERRTKDGGYVSVGTDITAIKQHERKMVELTGKYAEEKRRAEEANETKTRFLANMSHELRTPLNAIIGFSEIMHSGMLGPLGSEKYQDYCRDILSSGQYLLEVINDILDMSRIEAGRMKFDMENVRFDEVLAESLRVVQGRVDNKNLTLETDLADQLMLTADRRAIKQIAINLLSNAVKFTPEGGRIAIRSRKCGSMAYLTIADSGIGIPDEDLPRIGLPFEQVETELTKCHQGSGLGLAIAKSLAQLHGGAMRIFSAQGTGTAIVVRLPQDPSCPRLKAGFVADYAA